MSESIPHEENAPTEPAAEEVKTTYSLADVGCHNTREDIWIAIENKVYDVTKFIDEVNLITRHFRF